MLKSTPIVLRLAESQCPHCECKEVLSEGRANQHSNGQWNEHRLFRCGYRISYSPNYGREVVEHMCPQSRANKLRILQMRIAHDKLLDTINALDVDVTTSANLHKAIDFLLR